MSEVPRFSARFGEYARTLDCVHCGLCLPHCPTYTVTGREADSPRGRIHLLRSWAEESLTLSDDARERLDGCIVCRGCESVCPSGIRMGEMMEGFRHEMREKHPTGAAASGMARGLLGLLAHRDRIARITDWMEIYQRTGLDQVVDALLRAIAPGLARAHARRPRVPARAVRRIETDRTRPAGFPSIGPRRARVALFLGCVGAEWFAPVHRATIRVLQRNGCDVIVPHAQTCCGALHRHAGMLEEARPLLERNAQVFAALGVDAVVTNAAGCGASLKEPLDPGLAQPAYRDVSEFLSELGLVKPDRPVRQRVAYDQPCHLVHAQRLGRDVVEGLLSQIPELQWVALQGSERCCGAGGIYNLLQQDLAAAVLAEKVAAILESGAETVVTGNPGCAMQLEFGLRGAHVAVRHPVELLDSAYS